MNKLKKLITIIVLVIIPSILYTQTPYDSYAPSCAKIAMLKLPEIQNKIYNPDTLSNVKYVELNSKSGTLAYYDKQENLLYQDTLNPLEQKWWTKDPKMAKYPSMSPYNAFANNPILYVDTDGKDYTLYIDHKNKTMIVKANYYAIESEKSMSTDYVIKTGTEFWNNESCKYQYIVGEGKNQIVYDIKFELTKTVSDKQGNILLDPKASNSVSVISHSQLNRELLDLGIKNEAGGYNIHDIVKISSDYSGNDNVNKHEIGHSIGAEHYGELYNMMSKTLDQIFPQTNTENLESIFGKGGIGPLKSLQNQKSDIGQMKGITTEGTAPSDFENGNFIEKGK